MGKKQVKLQEQRLPFVITLKFYCHALQFQRAAFVAERKTHSSTYKQSEINRKKHLGGHTQSSSEVEWPPLNTNRED